LVHKNRLSSDCGKKCCIFLVKKGDEKRFFLSKKDDKMLKKGENFERAKTVKMVIILRF
jgi:hypothetical protein